MTGLAAIAFVAHVFAETMVWPLLRKETYTLKQLDTYLSASRGSIVSVLFAFGAAKDLETVLIILCLSVLALIPFSAAPLVGYVYDPHNITMPFKASYLPAGGMGPIFTQRGTPPIMPSSVSQAVSKYIAWSNQLSSEPLPEYRDWYVNRDYLSELGKITVNAVRLEKSIKCTGDSLELKHPPGDNFLTVATPLPQRHPGRKWSAKRVKIRNQPRLTMWVHDFEFISPHRTRSTLIFAALNGTIEAGTVTYAPTTWRKNWSKGISAVSCTVDVELVDDTLIVGSGYIKPPEPITSVDIVGTGNGGNINEIALWFGVARTVVGVNVEGHQPLFELGAYGLLISFTSTTQSTNGTSWTLQNLVHFIDVSMGAMATASSKAFFKGVANVTIPSLQHTTKLDPARPPLLAIPIFLALGVVIVLLLESMRLHRRYPVPLMR
ncbi:hypothetical protein CEP54_013574 [Fusarium duplospermum]|uniref:Transmembrane protein n=1 Tax=Fusarium duplospermum TaxID=1325734 RepID=A0A428P230_9HYPO|nr:hypothetical protein CEP54_013574 [Fusarium duplospermum]